jgi:hypothetical protein
VAQEVVGRPAQIGDLRDQHRFDPVHARKNERRSKAVGLLAELIGDERRRTDKKFDKADATIAELREEIAALAHQVEIQKATRGDTDGQALPAGSCDQNPARRARRSHDSRLGRHDR